MPDTTKPHRAVWIGRTISALVVAALLADGAMQLFAPAQIASMMQETGFAMDLSPTLGGIMVACAVIYGIPATFVLGAILVTGFLGGAICAHVRLGELAHLERVCADWNRESGCESGVGCDSKASGWN